MFCSVKSRFSLTCELILFQGYLYWVRVRIPPEFRLVRLNLLPGEVFQKRPWLPTFLLPEVELITSSNLTHLPTGFSTT